ncbi:MAG: ATP synthase F1 subunit epsilon [Planctomycetota bacterium]
MSKTFKFEIIAPEKIIYSDTVKSIKAAGTEGAFGVLADHAPLISEIDAGVLSVVDANDKTFDFTLDGGFLEVQSNNVVVLANSYVKEGDVNVGKAHAGKEAAKKAAHA